MKAALCIALLALLAVSAVVDANLFVPLRKRGPKPMSAAQAAMVAAGYPVPLKGNIAQYGEYVDKAMGVPFNCCCGLSCQADMMKGGKRHVAIFDFGKFQKRGFLALCEW